MHFCLQVILQFMKIPKPITDLAESFQRLPGVGPKTAQRLAFYLLHVPTVEIENFARSLTSLKKDTVLCSICKNVSGADPCPVCKDEKRDTTKILVVENPFETIAFEKTGKYNGLYHVLHGKISPLENIGPDEIFVEDLFRRLKNGSAGVTEVIIATNPTMEGEATAMYLTKKLKEINSELEVTRLGMGIPTGADLEYADDVTLVRALEGRRQI